MPHVHVDSSEVDIEVADGETLFLAAHRAGYYWPTTCNGAGTCLICWTLIEDGAERCSPVGEWEQEQIDHLKTFVNHHDKQVRLACRVRPLGDIVVRKTGVKKFSAMFKKLARSENAPRTSFT